MENLEIRKIEYFFQAIIENIVKFLKELICLLVLKPPPCSFLGPYDYNLLSCDLHSHFWGPWESDSPGPESLHFSSLCLFFCSTSFL